VQHVQHVQLEQRQMTDGQGGVLHEDVKDQQAMALALQHWEQRRVYEHERGKQPDSTAQPRAARKIKLHHSGGRPSDPNNGPPVPPADALELGSPAGAGAVTWL
jgi:hypothetical protein